MVLQEHFAHRVRKGQTCSSVAETPWAVASLQQDPRDARGAMRGSLAGTNTGPGAAPAGTARVRHMVGARLLSPELSINCIRSSELSPGPRWEPGKVTSPPWLCSAASRRGLRPP